MSAGANLELKLKCWRGHASERALTRRGLYGMVTEKIGECGLDPASASYRVDAAALVMRVCVNPVIELLDFRSPGVCGILYKTPHSTSIGLNARRAAAGRNFDCMHELIHYWFHDDRLFYCGDLGSGQGGTQGDYLEWQANEGAAQFLMPYQNFIPRYLKGFDAFLRRLPPDRACAALTETLAEDYGVGRAAVEYRIDGLRSEIRQYAGGASMGALDILSRRAGAAKSS